MELSESSLCMAVGVYFINFNFSIFGIILILKNKLRFSERLSQMLDFNFDFITHTKKSDFEKKKLRCPFKNFHSFRKFLNVFDYLPPDAGHSKTTVQENWPFRNSAGKLGRVSNFT